MQIGLAASGAVHIRLLVEADSRQVRRWAAGDAVIPEHISEWLGHRSRIAKSIKRRAAAVRG